MALEKPDYSSRASISAAKLMAGTVGTMVAAVSSVGMATVSAAFMGFDKWVGCFNAAFLVASIGTVFTAGSAGRKFSYYMQQDDAEKAIKTTGQVAKAAFWGAAVGIFSYAVKDKFIDNKNSASMTSPQKNVWVMPQKIPLKKPEHTYYL